MSDEHYNSLDSLVGLSGFRCIVTDPPWPIDRIAPMPRVSEGWIDIRKKSNHGKQFTRGKTFREVPVPYHCMSVEEISALPVKTLVEKDAHLYLWTINRHLESAYSVARAWGFRPVQVLTWVKKPRGICLGTFTSTTEFVLFCRRGTLTAKLRLDSTWWNWPRSNTHSRKPEAFQDMVEMVSPGPYLELFARRPRLNWTVWGNEVVTQNPHQN
ncbi:MAG: hypothetical protein K9N51_02320, partial [Candidatus Pacebacteria bacterium]|nr:hypothetical protein [Candidatus Paceibacterota bacterium]